MNPIECASNKKRNSVAMLRQLVAILIVVITMETLQTTTSASGGNKLKILHNGAGSLTVKVNEEWRAQSSTV